MRIEASIGGMRLCYIAILLLFLHEICAQFDYEKRACELRRTPGLHEKCGEYAYLIVKPVLMEVKTLQQTIQQKNKEFKEQEVKLNLQVSKVVEKKREITELHARNQELQKELSNREAQLKKIAEHIMPLNEFDSKPEMSKASDFEKLLSKLNFLKDHIELLEKKMAEKERVVNHLYISLDELETGIENCHMKKAKAESKLRALESTNSLFRSESLRLERNSTELLAIQHNYDKLHKEFQAISKRYPNSCESTEKVSTFNIIPVNTVQVLCDKGWIVIQQCRTGCLELERSYTVYKRGFEDFVGNFFMGLEKLYLFTKELGHELYVHLEDSKGDIRFARYDDFQLDRMGEEFTLKSLGSYEGNAGDSWRRFEGLPLPKNEHIVQQDCAYEQAEGWWYSSRCGYSNFEDNRDSTLGQFWHGWLGLGPKLKFIQMKIRAKP